MRNDREMTMGRICVYCSRNSTILYTTTKSTFDILREEVDHLYRFEEHAKDRALAEEAPCEHHRRPPCSRQHRLGRLHLATHRPKWDRSLRLVGPPCAPCSCCIVRFVMETLSFVACRLSLVVELLGLGKGSDRWACREQNV